MFIHTNFFSAPWQVAYVVDPLLGDYAFFGWEGSSLVRFAAWDVRTDSGRSAKSSAAPSQPPISASRHSTIGRLGWLALGLTVGGLVGVGLGTLLTSDPVTGDGPSRPPPVSVAGDVIVLLAGAVGARPGHDAPDRGAPSSGPATPTSPTITASTSVTATG